MDIWFALNEFCRSAARRPTRCLLAACVVGGIADQSNAFPIDFDVAGASHFAVLSVSSRTPKSEAGQGALKETQPAQAKSNALRAAATTLEGSGGKTISARTTTGSGTPVPKQGTKTGSVDTLTLSGQNKSESPVYEVLRGWTMNSANVDVAANAASSAVLFNVLENSGVTWDEIVSHAAQGPPKKFPPGILVPR
jgi:hypothetical protein